MVRGLLLAGWIVLLMLCPWWLGLLLLLLAAAGALFYARRAMSLSEGCRLAAKWGLPGVLFAVQRALGGDLVAWGAALLGALVGFSLIALLESLLPRDVRPRTAVSTVSPEWREIALAPVGPPAHIIELTPPAWDEAAEIRDPRGQAQYQATSPGEGRYRLADGLVLERLDARCAFSPAGRWFAAGLADGRGLALLDRDRGRTKPHRLRGWELCGWDEGEGPWLSRETDGVPVPLHEALGQDVSHA
jgi:hypothetical protein